ncbi:MAG: mevalonate kinase [Thermoprotei archaeon]|nr:MAG: mevalonate kinase [Thermoprotei archaeon]
MRVLSRVVVKVPTKITIAGEHAVVYGVPAVAAAIPRFILITMSLRSDNRIVVETQGLYARLSRVALDRSSDSVESLASEDDARRALSYVTTALRLCEEFLGVGERGYDVYIESDLPASIGLGTSAAISVGTIAGCLKLRGGDPEEYRVRVAELGWRTELEVQGAASPMDTFTTALGGIRYIDPGAGSVDRIATWIAPAKPIPLVVGYTPRRGTTAELVAKVRRLRSSAPQLFDRVMEVIGDIANAIRRAIEVGDLELLGRLVTVNHGLLEALGVVDREHSLIIHSLLEAGALGAKTSGAGSGGAFLAIAPSADKAGEIAIVAKGLGATVVATGIYPRGFSVEGQRPRPRPRSSLS